MPRKLHWKQVQMKKREAEYYNEYIEEAIAAIEEAQSYLDLSNHRCASCGSIRYRTHRDKLKANVLGIAITKLKEQYSNEGGVYADRELDV